MQTAWPFLKKRAQNRKSGNMKMKRAEANRTWSLWLLVKNVNLNIKQATRSNKKLFSSREHCKSTILCLHLQQRIKGKRLQNTAQGKVPFLLLQIYLPLHLMLPIKNCSLNNLQGPVLSSTSDQFSLSRCILRIISFTCFPGSFSMPA